jgi:hypothetical protein
MHDNSKFKVRVNERVGRTKRLQRRRHGVAPRGRAQCGREQRGHPRRLAYSVDFSQWVALVNNIPTLPSRLNGFSIADVAASSQSYDLNRRRCAVRRSPARPAGGARRNESPQSTPVAAAQPHTSGPSSCGRPPVQSVRRPLPHLVAYGSTNK